LAVAEIGVIDNAARSRTVVGDDGRTYVEIYEIDKEAPAFFPSTNPPGSAHYFAKVKLFRKDGIDLTYIASRSGYWIDGGCFEMDVNVPYRTDK
jgi:hypothetical protein